MLFSKPRPTIPFKQWLVSDKENRRLFRIFLSIIVIQFAVFKFFYPYPNFMPPDSNSYIEAASNNQMINTWAIGYSKFLRIFSTFTRSDWALVIFQYLLIEGSVLYFLFSIRYLLTPAKWVFRILLCLSVLNPLLPHISNFIGSDTLYTALSLIWFTQLCWILYRPGRKLFLFHAVILLFTFMVRYNALYFPVISIIIIGRASIDRKVKWAGIAAILLLVGIFVGQTEYEYYNKTKTWQFSAFGGWEMSANALYGYAHTEGTDTAKIPVRFRSLHALVNRHMDSIRDLVPRPDREVGIYYLWDFKSPLKVFEAERWAKDPTTPHFIQWASMGPLYADYGKYLILHHSVPFIQYYLWPNFIRYYCPPTYFMGFYNIREHHVDPVVVKWFGWKSNRISNYFNDVRIEITEIFPVLLAIINLTFVVCTIAFTILGGFKQCSGLFRQIFWLMFIIWIGNMVFSVFTAPIELRYQLFPMITTLAFLCLLLPFLVEESFSKKPVVPTLVDPPIPC